MKGKFVLGVILGFYLVCFAQSTFASIESRENTKKPNLVFIMTDQQRFDAMSCAGNTILQTPNMDRLAREGVIFTNTYSANPVCVPSRAVFLTGLSSVNAHVETNGDYLSEDVPNVPTFDSILKKDGYSAEYYGKWHTPYQFARCYDNDVYPIGNHYGLPHIITTYKEWLLKKGVPKKEPGPGELFSGRNQRPYTPVGPDYNTDKVNLSTEEKMKLNAKQSTQFGKIDLPPRISYAAYTAEETINAIERLKGGPFTITCSFDPPHPPMVVQEPYFSSYPPETIPVPESIDDPMEDSPYMQRWQRKDEKRYADVENIKNMRSVYYGMVKEIDDWVGDILNKLDELGLAENTMVIFTSDHGEQLGDHGLHSKSMFYEGAVHVPLLMRFPGKIKPGTKVESPVSTMDVCPTILDYLNQPIPECDGISLRTFIEGKPVKHDVIAYSTGNSEPNYMIRSGDLKLMMGQDENNNGINALYDLKNDPLEMKNLLVSPTSEKNKKQGKKMKKKLVKWMEKHEPHKADGIKNRKLYPIN
ncbi:MAG: sulfatase-like hydrolase/transferase [Draconibacterium sp.]|nr:sulfatase-like hydrolase/transferase [Draconibacterium sp.]